MADKPETKSCQVLTPIGYITLRNVSLEEAVAAENVIIETIYATWRRLKPEDFKAEGSFEPEALSEPIR